MIKHKEILQDILDGKAVQYQPPLDNQWYDHAPVAETVVEVAETTQGQWRVKPEPVIYRYELVRDGEGGMPLLVHQQGDGVYGARRFRLEIDPDTLTVTAVMEDA